MRQFNKFCITFFLCSLMCVTNADTATINAVSCSQYNVQTAVNSAGDGDTVSIPTGTCTWASGIRLDLDDTDRSLTIIGAGIGNTIIKPNFATGWGGGGWNMPFWVKTKSGQAFRISGIEFQSGGSESGDYAAVTIQGYSKSIRIDHCKFDQLKIGAIRLEDHLNGVIDHINVNNPQTGLAVRLYMSGYAGTGTDASWATAANLGSSDALFIEDSTFVASTSPDVGYIIHDIGSGARAVIRYNTYTDCVFETHGTDSTGRQRGGRTFEVYNNTMSLISRAGSGLQPMGIRSGTGVIYNNTFHSGYNHGPRLWIKRVGESHAPWGQCDDAIASGLCTGDYETACTSDSNCTGNGTCSHWVDDPTGDGIGYPCRDQVGRGIDTGPTTAQALEPFYEWNNVNQSSGNVDFWVDNAYSSYIMAGRDYYKDTSKPGYTAYIYPHPLVTTATPGPSAPKNLRIIQP
jgi:hypothetical protein